MLCYFLKVLYIYITSAYGLGPILAYWMVGHIFQYRTSGLCPIILIPLWQKAWWHPLCVSWEWPDFTTKKS